MTAFEAGLGRAVQQERHALGHAKAGARTADGELARMVNGVAAELVTHPNPPPPGAPLRVCFGSTPVA